MEIFAFTNAPCKIPYNCCRKKIYKECAEGGLDSEWKIEHPTELCTFRDVLSKQILKYSPTHRVFPSDDKMRALAVQMKSKFRRFTGELECLDNVTYSIFMHHIINPALYLDQRDCVGI